VLKDGQSGLPGRTGSGKRPGAKEGRDSMLLSGGEKKKRGGSVKTVQGNLRKRTGEPGQQPGKPFYINQPRTGGPVEKEGEVVNQQRHWFSRHHSGLFTCTAQRKGRIGSVKLQNGNNQGHTENGSVGEFGRPKREKEAQTSYENEGRKSVRQSSQGAGDRKKSDPGMRHLKGEAYLRLLGTPKEQVGIPSGSGRYGKGRGQLYVGVS